MDSSSSTESWRGSPGPASWAGWSDGEGAGLTYDLHAIEAPRMAGFSLRTFVWALEHGATRWLLAPKILRSAGIDRLRRTELKEAPSVGPRLPLDGGFEHAGGAAPALEDLVGDVPETPGFRFETVADFARAYREGSTTPEEVARRVLEAVGKSEAHDPALRLLIAQQEADVLAQARAATARFEQGEPLGPLDGVPVAIKDEIDQTPYPTTVGTGFLGKTPATEDATVVARLRAAGALLIGKANMHEIGIGVTGLNPHHGCVRNPYGVGHHTGGSSSGSAASVAAGLCPLAVGADGGGSIRTPGALCGVVGLKATWGRISEHGAFPLCWSVAHVGPLAASVRDAALGYLLMAGPDPQDANTLRQPAPHLDRFGDDDLSGLRIGIYRPWYHDADADVVSACDEVLEILEAKGAQVVEIEIPHLDLYRVAHVVTITSEMCTAMQPFYERHRTEFGLDVRVSLALTRLLNSRDYVLAQQVRTRFVELCERLLQQVDLIVTPTTGSTAPAIAPDALPHGETDIAKTGSILRFVFPANLCGYPAITFPAGYDGSGLPVGFQAMARPWEEHLLLRVAEVVERQVERRKPPAHFPILRP